MLVPHFPTHVDVAKRAMPLAPRARTLAESLPVVALSKVNHFSRYGPRQELELARLNFITK